MTRSPTAHTRALQPTRNMEAKYLLVAALISLVLPVSSRPQDYGSEPGMPYDFQWAVVAPEYGNDYSHRQSSDGRVTQGEYRVALPDGRVQLVSFVADENGYQADVTYEGQAQYPAAASQPGYTYV